MPTKKLQQLLNELRQELADKKGLDDNAKQELKSAAQDIAAALDDPDAKAADGDQLIRMATEFEAEHPRLAGILKDIADTLSKLGI